ncbi:outer membrane protein assembly factor BamA [Qipengyuania sediminis]|uniref:outer membrane protein assembly factor BamA n=1 Tax=Qipengyuania sediminis TaxID=1532023 RepID=UPI001059FB09|nr:outer membrane protein assembly factor BamA [Qipengyuania sediminis]
MPTSRIAAALLAGTMLAGAAPLTAQTAQQPATPPAAAPAPATELVRTLAVAGAQRLEPNTILSYIRLRPGDPWNQAAGDQVLKELYATELFSNATVAFEAGNVVITVVENPVVNRILLEGNKRIKEDKILPEIKLAPRQIFTRSKVRADVARIIELYKRQGRFAATVEPKMVQLAQNRVDVVFEISEGPKSKVRQINIIGNEAFDDGELKGEMVTKEARLLSFFSSNTSYDPDRLAFDQQKLRQFYLTQGYADFRVVSAVAELTPDKEDFIITYVVEEGERYKFGDVKVDSQLRDFDGTQLASNLPMKTGDFYNAKLVEDTVEQFTDLAGTFGYAFADVDPQFSRNKDTLTMDVSFVLKEAPRVYVERVDVNGNTLTQDKVVRREFRLAEGDAFNTLSVKRTTARIRSLGYFQENFEVEQKDGSAPDRIVLEANVEEKATGELQLSAGFSSIENFILQGAIRQRNFRGRGQTVGLSINYSSFSQSAQASFTEPYLFDKNVSAGVDIYRRDLSNFNFTGGDRNTTFEQTTTGGSLRIGVPLTEYASVIGSYTLNLDDITLDENIYFSDRQNPPLFECDPLIAGRYLCDAIGSRTSSILGLTVALDTTDSRVRPTRGRSIALTGEVAGLGGDTKYFRLRGRAAQFWPIGGGFVFSLSGEGGAIRSFEDRGIAGQDDVRLNDRFFLGEPQIRGFDIRGVGPRVLRYPYDADGNLITDRERIGDDAIGGNAYYLGRAEIEIPLGAGARELGLRPSVFVDVGALFNVTRPLLTQNLPGNTIFIPSRDANGVPLFFFAGDPATPADDRTLAIPPGGTVPAGFVALGQSTDPFQEVFLGDTASPRVSVGIGVNWNSPFGPLRIDLAHAIKKEPGDDTKLFSFNVGTQF